MTEHIHNGLDTFKELTKLGFAVYFGSNPDFLVKVGYPAHTSNCHIWPAEGRIKYLFDPREDIKVTYQTPVSSTTVNLKGWQEESEGTSIIYNPETSKLMLMGEGQSLELTSQKGILEIPFTDGRGIDHQCMIHNSPKDFGELKVDYIVFSPVAYGLMKGILNAKRDLK